MIARFESDISCPAINSNNRIITEIETISSIVFRIDKIK